MSTKFKKMLCDISTSKIIKWELHWIYRMWSYSMWVFFFYLIGSIRLHCMWEIKTFARDWQHQSTLCVHSVMDWKCRDKSQSPIKVAGWHPEQLDRKLRPRADQPTPNPLVNPEPPHPHPPSLLQGLAGRWGFLSSWTSLDSSGPDALTSACH